MEIDSSLLQQLPSSNRYSFFCAWLDAVSKSLAWQRSFATRDLRSANAPSLLYPVMVETLRNRSTLTAADAENARNVMLAVWAVGTRDERGIPIPRKASSRRVALHNLLTGLYTVYQRNPDCLPQSGNQAHWSDLADVVMVSTWAVNRDKLLAVQRKHTVVAPVVTKDAPQRIELGCCLEL